MNPCRNPQCRKPALSDSEADSRGVPHGVCSLRCSVVVLAHEVDDSHQVT